MTKTTTTSSSAIPLIRWFISSATMTAPQAAAPIAFALLALGLTGETSGGAAMILAMTLAQVAGAIPITRLGRGYAPTRFLRLLVVFRTLALCAVALLAHLGFALPWLVAVCALAGCVNGAAAGYLRTVLNALAPASKLPRALGIAATLNETTFVLAPIAASGLGTVSPVFAVLTLALLGALPALLLPSVSLETPVDSQHASGGSIINPSILLWLVCAAAGGATVAALEIGAVALALHFGYAPALAIMFTIPLCLASVAGGIWVSVRNRMASRKAVLIQLSVMMVGALLAALQLSMPVTVLGAVLIGAVLAPLGTYYSLVLDKIAPPTRRAEVFALLRTANAVGVISVSAIMTIFSLSTSLITVSCFMALVVLVVGLSSRREPE